MSPRAYVTASVFGVVLCVAHEAVAQPDASIDRIREKSLEFFQAVEDKSLTTYVKGRESDFERTYSTFHYLVTPDKIAEVAGYIPSAPDAEAESAYRRLKMWLTYQTIRARSAAEIDGGNNYLADTRIVVGGEEITLRNVVHRMAEEEDRSARRQWSFAFTEFLENVNVYLQQAVHLSNEAATDLGYEGYIDFIQQYHGFDLAAARTRARAFLDASTDLYRELLHEQIEATFGGALTPEDVRFYDMPQVWAATRFDRGLDKKKPFQVIEKAFERAGLSLDKSDSWQVDDEEAKVEHALDGAHTYFNKLTQSASTVGWKPASGFQAYTGMLREAGRQVFHGRGGGAYFENHFFGDPTMGYAIGYLFENLMESAAFLDQNSKLDADQIEAARRAHMFLRLAQARDHAGRVLFLPELYGDTKQPDEVYESIFEPIRLWGSTQIDRAMFMSADDGFECVAKFHGSVLAVAIQQTLEKRLGPDWFSKKDAAKELNAIWSEGVRKSLDDYASALGIPDLDPSILVDDVSAAALGERAAADH